MHANIKVRKSKEIKCTQIKTLEFPCVEIKESDEGLVNKTHAKISGDERYICMKILKEKKNMNIKK